MEINRDRKGHYYILFKATVTEEVRYVNFSLSSGVISVDLNADNISWCDLDGNGNYLAGGVYKFCLDGMSSGERKSLLGHICSCIIRRCYVMKKTLVIESLDLKKKLSSLEYGNRKSNRAVSSFAYRLMTELLTAGAARWFVGIHFINPEYTSVAGKTRYMRHYGITVHESAACCIGRKALGLTESSPAPFRPLLAKRKIKSHRHMWQLISNTSKGILPGYFQKKIKPFYTKKKLSNQFPVSYKGKIRFVV